MKILALDPGRTIGWAYMDLPDDNLRAGGPTLQGYGEWNLASQPHYSLWRHLEVIRNKPEKICYEDVIFGNVQFKDTMQDELVGVIKLYCQSENIDVLPVASSSVRALVLDMLFDRGNFTGMSRRNIKVTKDDVSKLARELFNLPEKVKDPTTNRLRKFSVHITDAIGVGLATPRALELRMKESGA